MLGPRASAQQIGILCRQVQFGHVGLNTYVSDPTAHVFITDDSVPSDCSLGLEHKLIL
jgi:hypothetical protein